VFIGAFGLAWPIAVRLTEPKSLQAASKDRRGKVTIG
jgi:hypothetical protein